jgi:hypothetical protein
LGAPSPEANFIFRLTGQELENLMSQFATSRWGGRRIGFISGD